MQVFLETDRLTLRRFTKADESNLFELNSDPEVMRFLTGGTATPRDEVRTRILPAFLGYYERFDGFGFWAAVETSTGQFLGWFHFRPPLRDEAVPAGWDEDGVIELGYRLRRTAWGKGYATEGSLALIDRGFTEFGVRRVVAETMAGNRGSRRVLEKAGLTQTGFVAAPGPAGAADDEQDFVVYELFRAEWETRRAEGRRAAR
ncbi:MAG: GNAT family N-acetyltransferase [Streptosporangiaceae bacterium]